MRHRHAASAMQRAQPEESRRSATTHPRVKNPRSLNLVPVRSGLCDCGMGRGDFLVFPLGNGCRQEAGFFVGVRSVVMFGLERFQGFVAGFGLRGGVGMGHDETSFWSSENTAQPERDRYVDESTRISNARCCTATSSL
jgi:hypothetical protein